MLRLLHAQRQTQGIVIFGKGVSLPDSIRLQVLTTPIENFSS